MNKSFMNNYSASVQNALDKYENDIIHSLTIVRTPLAKAVDTIINIGSFGKSANVKSKHDYDNLFHLNVLINDRYTLEKNEIINFTKQDTRTKTSESLIVNQIPSGLSIKMLLSNTKQLQGPKYYRYSASSNNCQDFIKAMFVSNGITDDRYIEFIKQDTEAIFKNNANLRKLANNVTDAAAIGNLAVSQLEDTVNDTIHTVNKSGKKLGRKIKKVFGGGELPDSPDFKKMKVADLKRIIKVNKGEYGRKINITGLRKKELVELVKELY